MLSKAAAMFCSLSIRIFWIFVSLWALYKLSFLRLKVVLVLKQYTQARYWLAFLLPAVAKLLFQAIQSMIILF